MYGWRARLGFVLASSNGIVEAESMKIVPDGVSCHFTRVLYREITKEGALGIVQATEEAGRLLAGGTNAVGVDVVALTHSEASMARGPHGDKEIIKLIEKATGVKATTTATGIVSALKKLKVKSVAGFVPHVRTEMYAQAKEFLEGNGFKVIGVKGGPFTTAQDVARQPPEVAYRLIKAADNPKADAIVTGVLNLRTVEIVEALERDLGKPVIAGCQATVWSALRTAGIEESIPGFGRLLQV